MEFPKRLYVVVDAEGTLFAGEGLADLPEILLNNGVEIGVYARRRTVTVEVTRKFKPIKGQPSEETEDPQAPVDPLQM